MIFLRKTNYFHKKFIDNKDLNHIKLYFWLTLLK